MQTAQTRTAEIVNDGWQAGGAFEDIIDALKKEGHICDRLWLVGQRLLDDMRQYHGASGGLVSSYGQSIGGGDGYPLPLAAPVNFMAQQRMERVMKGLRIHERELFDFMVRSRDLTRGKLSDWGRQKSGYKNERATTALATGQIRALLETLFELYPPYTAPS